MAIILLIQFSPVQTWLVHKATTILSDKLQTRVEVKSVNLSFFNKIVLNGVYVQDLNNTDTLLYADRISASIKKIPVFGNELSIGTLRLLEGEFNLKSDTTGANIGNLIKRLSSKNKQVDTIKTPSSLKINVNNLEIRDFNFTFKQYSANKIAQNPNSIDFKNIAVDSLQLKANNIRIQNDTLFFDVKLLALREKSGYILRQLKADSYIVPGKVIYLNNVEVKDDYSDLRLKHYSMSYNGGAEFNNFIDKVVLSGDLDSAKVSLQSIGYFAPAMQNIPITVIATGLVTGSVSDLNSNNLSIEGLDHTIVKGKFSISGLPDINETIIFADFKELNTHPKDFFNALSKVTGNKMSSLSNFLSNVNQLNFKGSFTGLYNDFVANGNFVSNLGTIKLDVLFKEGNNKTVDFSGRISTPKFDAGKLLKTNLIGNTSFNLKTNGKIPQNGSLDMFSEGVISELMLNNYRYENIKLSGVVKDKEFNGSVDISDQNIDLIFVGKVNYMGTDTDPVPIFDFNANIKHIDFVKLNFNKRDSISQFRGKILANFKGDNITNYVGEIKLTDAFYKDDEENLDLGKVSLVSQEQNGRNSLQLLSDFIEAQYVGQYQFGNFVNELKHIAYIYAPILRPQHIDITELHHEQTQRYEVHVKTKKSGRLARIILPGLFIAENSTFDLLVDTSHNVSLNVNSKSIKLNKNEFNNIVVNTKNVADSMLLNLNCTDITVGGITFGNLIVDNSIKNSTISTHLKYNNSSEKKNAGNIFLNSKLRNSGDEKYHQLGFDVNLQPSEIILNDSLWKLMPSNIKIDSSRIDVSNFKFLKDEQYLTVEGTVSHNPNDTIIMRLQNYDFKGFNTLFQSLGYTITGNVSGAAEVSNIYNTPLLMINLNAYDITINNDTLGNITVASFWDDEYERLNIITRIFNNREINANVNGFFRPKDNSLQFDMIMYKLKFGYIEPFLKGIASGIQGNASGKLSLRGKFNDPTFSGKIDLNQTSMLIDYLQTRYKVDATINIEKSKISITKGVLYDLNNHTGELNVVLNHKNFKDINFDVNATLNNMMCLNTNVNNNPLFYGTSYATGGIRINGTPSNIHFNITAQADKNSNLSIPLSSTVQAKEASMLTFKKDDRIVEKEDIDYNANNNTAKTKIDFGLDLTVTPETNIQILIDEKAGDIIKAQGQGNLKIDVDPSINLFNIVGDYTISKGEYKFTLPNFNLVSKTFIINKGSKIIFNGDVTGATLDVQASYKTSASIMPLIASAGDSSRISKKYTVDCQIVITGKMAHPTLKFNIEFPNLDPESKAQIMSIMNTEEKMTTQFLALLVTHSFIPDQQYNVNMGTTSVLGNATELLSGQIGNLISMLDLPIPLDIGIDAGLDNNQQLNEFGFNANTILFDRVIINGSIGNNSRANRQWIGDFEMEVLLGKNGNYRLKGFSRSSDYFTNDLEFNMQGIGLSYQTEFSNFMDLFRKKKKLQKEVNPLKVLPNKENMSSDTINKKPNQPLLKNVDSNQ